MIAAVMVTGHPVEVLALDLPPLVVDYRYPDPKLIDLISKMTNPVYTARPTMEEILKISRGF